MQRSREQDGGKPLAPVDSRLVGRPPRLEKLHELLARGVIVPFSIAPNDVDEIIDRFGAAPFAVQGKREIEPRLMVERIGCDLLFQLAKGTNRFRLLGEFERRARGSDRRVVRLGFWNKRERLLGLIECTGAHITARKPGERGNIAAILRQHLRIEIGGAGGIALGEGLLGVFQQNPSLRRRCGPW